MFEENSFVFTFVAKLYGKRYFLSQWPGRTLFLNCDYVIAKITVDCERCQAQTRILALNRLFIQFATSLI